MLLIRGKENSNKVKTQESGIISEIPDDLLTVAFPHVTGEKRETFDVTDILKKKFRIHETHKDIFSYFMKGYVSRSFLDFTELWIKGFFEALKKMLVVKNNQLIILSGKEGYDPLPNFLINLFYLLQNDTVKLIIINETEPDRFDRKIIPLNYKANFSLTDPEVLMLLILNERHDSQGNLVYTNVNSIVDFITDKNLTHYLPSKRNTGRNYFGYYKYLKKLSIQMTEAGLLEKLTSGNTTSYTISDTGKCYLEICQQITDFLPNTVSDVLRNIENIRVLLKRKA